MIFILAAAITETWQNGVEWHLDRDQIGEVINIAVAAMTLFIASVVLRNSSASSCRRTQAWNACRQEMFPGHAGDILLFFLVKLLSSIGVGLVAIVVTLLTCCITMLPFIGVVILLPTFVFLESDTLFFVDQFGDGFRVFTRERGELQ